MGRGKTNKNRNNDNNNNNTNSSSSGGKGHHGGRRRNGKGRPHYGNGSNGNNSNDVSKMEEYDGKGDLYVSAVTATGNFKMECYYALQGLHDTHWVAASDTQEGTIHDNNKILKKCTTDTEKHKERIFYRECIGTVLPASFRFSKDVPQQLIVKLENELHTILQQCCNTDTLNINNNDDIKKQQQEEVLVVEEEEGEINDTTTDKEETTTTSLQQTRQNRPSCSTRSILNPTEIIRTLSFLPHSYQIQCDKTTIRKHIGLKPLHNWLIQQTNSGYITRQETVSMIPPVLLNCQPNDLVLDMCAAPGSKTSQLLEVLTSHGSSNNKKIDNKGGDSGSNTNTNNSINRSSIEGCLIANDNNPQRAYMLVHQLKRINAYNPRVLITAVDAQFFPASIVQFTKLLCDVPCTGDGTTRKNINVWKNWTASAAFALHTLQFSIAWKGISQLCQTPMPIIQPTTTTTAETTSDPATTTTGTTAVNESGSTTTTTNTTDPTIQYDGSGGYMCYSTCSLNPIENEAVVAELLRRGNGAIELVDIDTLQHPSSTDTVEKDEDDDDPTNGMISFLRGFRTRPGWSTWKVLIEMKSRKQMKNQYNKINPKMQQLKRDNNDDKEQEETNMEVVMKEEEEEAVMKDTNKNDVETKGESEPVVDENNSTIVNEYQMDQEKMFAKKFDTTSYEYEHLVELANQCGLQCFDTYEDVLNTPEYHIRSKIKQSCFPPSLAEQEQFHLERCIRCLPHDNDTGGFFVALLRKVQPTSVTDQKYQKKYLANMLNTTTGKTINGSHQLQQILVDEEEEENEKQNNEESTPKCSTIEIDTEDVEDSVPSPELKRAKLDTSTIVPVEVPPATTPNPAIVGGSGDSFGADHDNGKDVEQVESTIIRLRGRNQKKRANNQDPTLKSNLMEGSHNLGNDDCVPVTDTILNPLIEFYGIHTETFPRNQYMARACASEIKTIYYVAQPVKQLIDAGIQERVTVIHTGLRGFARNNRNNQDAEVQYRVCQEGIYYLLPHMSSKRKLYTNERDFRVALATPGKTVHLSSFTESFAETIKSLSCGAFVMVLDLNNDDANTSTTAIDTKTDTGSTTGSVAVMSTDGSNGRTSHLQRNDNIIAAVMWKCRGDSVDSLIAKPDVDGMLSMLNALKGEPSTMEIVQSQ